MQSAAPCTPCTKRLARGRIAQDDRVIEISRVSTRFGEHVVHSELDLEVRRAEIFALVGGCGSGQIDAAARNDPAAATGLGLHPGARRRSADRRGRRALALRRRWGVMFQHGGLFGALTVSENVGLPLREHTELGRRVDR